METDADLTIYSYVDETYVWIYDSADNLIWEGIVNEGEPQVVSTPAGTYMCVGSSVEPTFGVGSGIWPEEEPGVIGDIGGEGMPHVTNGGLQVICVVWQGNPLLSHDTYDGKQITLKGIVRGIDPLKSYEYQWHFGDGSPDTSWTNLTNYYIIETTHTYAGAIGTPYTARLRVRSTDLTENADDTYPVTVRGDTRSTKANIAIDEGLWYMHKRLYRWTQDYGAGNVDYAHISGNSNVGYVGQLVESYENSGHIVRDASNPNSLWHEDPYAENVQRMINWILRNCISYSIGAQHAGHPEDYDGDGTPDGNDIGLYASWNTYEQGIAMLALASSQAPNWIAASVNRPDVDGRTYAEIVQDMGDFLSWAQGDENASRRGGWRYNPNYGDSDNSVTQWPTLGLQAAEQNFGTLIPPWVKDETITHWIPYSQGASSGGFGYTYAGYWENVAKTGAGLAELSWVGVKDDATDPLQWRITNAKAFINGSWGNGADDNYGNFGNYYAMYAVMKGAILTDPAIEFIGTHNWYEEYADWLITNQHSTGYWPEWSGWYNSDMSTAWAILILKASVFKLVPVAVLEASPNPVDINIEVTFDGSQSYDINEPPKNIVEYEFDFGDGSPVYTETAASAPDGLFDGKTTHEYDDYGTYNATLKVTNDDIPPQTSAPAAISMQVTMPNHPPTAVIDVLSGALPSSTPGIDYEGFTDIPISFDGSNSYDINADVGDYITEYAWDVDGAPFDYPILEITTTQTWSGPGVYDVSLRVKDLEDLFPDSPKYGYEYVKVRISVNNPPVADAGPDRTLEQTNLQGTPVVMDGSGSYDPDGLPLVSYAWSWNGGTASGVNPTITLPLGGPHTIELIVNDGALDSDPDTVTITVVDTKTPSVNAGNDLTVEQENADGTEVTIVGTASDICDASLDYEWSENGTVLGNNLTLTETFNLGKHILMLTATDDTGNIGSDEVIVTVKDTTPPTVDAGNDLSVEQENADGTEVTIVGTASDVCDALLDYEWSENGTVLGNNLILTETFNLGKHILMLTATDDTGNIGSDEVIVTVKDTTPPTVNAGPDQTVMEGTPVTLNGSAVDICDALLDYEWSENGTVLGNSPTLTHTFPVGEHTVTLEATDDSGNSGMDTVLVTVVTTGMTPGRVKGSGSFVQDEVRGNSLSGLVEYVDEEFTYDSIVYINRNKKILMRATDITHFIITDNTVMIEGDCNVNRDSGYTFELGIEDTNKLEIEYTNELGIECINPDTFVIKITDPVGNIIDATSATFNVGNFIVISYCDEPQ